MLHHLSPEQFIEKIADFKGADKWKFKNTTPVIIVFHSKIHVYAKGFRDVYDPISTEFPNIQTYEVIESENPEIAAAYNVTVFPTTFFIPPGGEPKIISGFISPEGVKEIIQKYLLNQ